jgi:GNAT superfamily N-acetyltransferase
MTNPIQVQKITAFNTIDLRSRILRPGQTVELCHYAEDEFESTFHLGIVLNNKVVCNGTFILQGNENFLDATCPYRLRGMATDLLFQRQGLGKHIIAEAIVELKKRGCDLLWFNARTSAEIFYDKLGFLALPEVFDIPLIGPHKVMYKRLKSI